MLPIVASIVSNLISNNMHKVADAVIEKGIDAVQDKLGIELKPEGQATPEYNEKLKAEAMKHEEFMAELDLKNMEGARNMQLAAMQSDDPLVRRFAYYFMGTWSLFAMIVIPCLIWVPIPEGQMRFADAFQGFLLGTIVAGMFQFLLGSSLGSRSKDKK
jgi:hypothetical protein